MGKTRPHFEVGTRPLKLHMRQWQRLSQPLTLIQWLGHLPWPWDVAISPTWDIENYGFEMYDIAMFGTSCTNLHSHKPQHMMFSFRRINIQFWDPWISRWATVNPFLPCLNQGRFWWRQSYFCLWSLCPGSTWTTFPCPDLNFGGFIHVPCDRNSKEPLLACLFSLMRPFLSTFPCFKMQTIDSWWLTIDKEFWKAGKTRKAFIRARRFRLNSIFYCHIKMTFSRPGHGTLFRMPWKMHPGSQMMCNLSLPFLLTSVVKAFS